MQHAREGITTLVECAKLDLLRHDLLPTRRRLRDWVDGKTGGALESRFCLIGADAWTRHCAVSYFVPRRGEHETTAADFPQCELKKGAGARAKTCAKLTRLEGEVLALVTRYEGNRLGSGFTLTARQRCAAGLPDAVGAMRCSRAMRRWESRVPSSATQSHRSGDGVSYQCPVEPDLPSGICLRRTRIPERLVVDGTKTLEKVLPAPEKSAASASLIYASDEEPGIRRRRAGAGFFYIRPDGERLKDVEALLRIRNLAIPPAWNHVWISPHPEGHLQATGRDQRGRKQYRYHPRWSACRDEVKYSSLTAFAEALPRLRSTIDADLGRRDLPRERVVASVVWLLDNTMIRVGNAAYARDNKSFGLTTLRDRHVEMPRPSPKMPVPAARRSGSPRRRCATGRSVRNSFSSWKAEPRPAPAPLCAGNRAGALDAARQE